MAVSASVYWPDPFQNVIDQGQGKPRSVRGVAFPMNSLGISVPYFRDFRPLCDKLYSEAFEVFLWWRAHAQMLASQPQFGDIAAILPFKTNYRRHARTYL